MKHQPLKETNLQEHPLMQTLLPFLKHNGNAPQHNTCHGEPHQEKNLQVLHQLIHQR